MNIMITAGNPRTEHRHCVSISIALHQRKGTRIGAMCVPFVRVITSLWGIALLSTDGITCMMKKLHYTVSSSWPHLCPSCWLECCRARNVEKDMPGWEASRLLPMGKSRI